MDVFIDSRLASNRMLENNKLFIGKVYFDVDSFTHYKLIEADIGFS